MFGWLKAFNDQWLNNVFALLSITLPAAGVIWYKIKSNLVKQHVIVIGEHFRTIVEKVSSGSIEQRIASAVLLRRFFDPDTEFGLNRLPYAKDCLAVTCALLKVTATSNLQKILSDNLKYAPASLLHHADFQRANLSKAYLGAEINEDPIDLSGSDFFQANLAGTNLKRAILSNAVFVETNISSTVLRNANLFRANFAAATLNGADLTDADLREANFTNAKIINCKFGNAKLCGAIFQGSTGYGNKFDEMLLNYVDEGRDFSQRQKKIFLSKPGILDARQNKILEDIRGLIISKGHEVIELNRGDYDSASVVSKLKTKIADCGAIIVFGLRSLHIFNGEYRMGTDDYRSIESVSLSTPWNQTEAGMAAMQEKRMLLIHEEEVVDGIFDPAVQDSFISRVTLENSLKRNGENVECWLDLLGRSSYQSAHMTLPESPELLVKSV